MARLTKAEQAKRAEAAQRLREVLKPGDTVYCVLRHASSSGMLRVIDLVLMPKAGEDRESPFWLGRLAAEATGMPYDDRKDGVRIGGAGMDMGFALVYDLAATLWPDGFGCIGEGDCNSQRCPSNEHSNGDRSYAPHTEDAPHWHRSGGYALVHRWL